MSVLQPHASEPESTKDEQFADLLEQLGNDVGSSGDVEWGESRQLEVGMTVHGWWRGEATFTGDFGPTPVYLMRDAGGVDFYFFGGRAQLDNKIRRAAPKVGDKVAVRRLEDGTPEPGKNAPWRVRVVVAPGGGTMPGADDADEPLPF